MNNFHEIVTESVLIPMIDLHYVPFYSNTSMSQLCPQVNCEDSVVQEYLGISAYIIPLIWDI